MLLLERDEPLALLRARIAGLRGEAMAGGNVLVHGEAGVGKTSLLRQLQAETAREVEWLGGVCEPLLAPPPLAPLLDWADRLPPSLGAAVRAGRQSAELMAGLVQLLRGRGQPTVLVIDDAQWADGATLDLLRYLGRRLADTRALLVLAWRDDAVATDHPLRALPGLLPLRHTSRLALQPLSAAARDAVELVSVVPGALDFGVLDAVLDEAAAGVEHAAAAGLLRHEGGAVRFRHELARQAVASTLSTRKRQALHAALFDALSLRGASAAVLVHHAEHGALEAATLRLAPLAAYEAAQGRAHRQAADLYALTLRHGDALDDAERARLQALLADQCLLVNRFDDALAAREQALALHRRRGDRRAEGVELRQLARVHWLRGRSADGVPLARAAIDVLAGAPGAEREHAMALATMAQLHVLDATADAALVWGTRALPVLEAAADAEGLTYLLNTLGSARLRTSDDAAAWAQLERSLAIALEHGWQEHALRAYVNLASLALAHRRHDILERACRAGLAYCAAQDIDLFYPVW